MKVKTFVDRPILSAVISVAIVFIGLIALKQLPIEQFPEIAPPTISVSASYTGASAETVQKSVIVPLEEAINGVENMLYMTSSATNNGSATITIFFRQGTDPDMATVNVQNRIAVAQGLLPAEVTKSGVSVSKRQTSNIKGLALYSPDGSFDNNFLDNYLKINIVPQLSRITGVGGVNVFGADYALRIWLDPARMAQYGLMPSDITAVLGEQNIEFPTGTLGANSNATFQYIMKYRGRFEDESDYGNMVIKSLPSGEVLRIKDVADIELGSVSYDFGKSVNGAPGSICMISQTSGSNANEIIENIDKLTEQIRRDLPKGVVLTDLMNTKDFLDASIDKVIETLIEAILLVILVVYIFLQSFRSTIIPAVAIIVSLIGTFALIYVIGFTINMLTLFALVLVIGTVVDDAIVVVEAVQAKFDEGYKSPYLATISAMKGITSALVTTTIVFMAVFIPVSFMGGATGTFYTQFGLTMAVAVGISTINALTMSPALCALIMTPHADAAEGEKLSFSSRFHIAFDSAFNIMVQKYKSHVLFFLKRKWFATILLLASIGGLYYMINTTKTALVPDEDMGVVFVNVMAPPGSSLTETDIIMSQINERLSTIPQIKHCAKISGYGMMSGQGSANGMFILRLKDWSERPNPQDAVNAVIGQVYGRTADIKSAMIMAFAPPMITGYGMSNGFEFSLQNRSGGDAVELYEHASKFLMALNQRPEVAMAYTSFNPRFPQYMLEVDAALCKRNGVSPANVLSTLSGYVGGSYSSNMNKYSKLYRVMIQASPDDYKSLESLDNMFVRTDKGEMSPINQYITLTKVYGPESLTRFNMFPSIAVNGRAADGYSSGQAIQAIKEVAEQVLPIGFGYEFSGMTLEEDSVGDSTMIVYAVCIVFVFLILCALYESLFIPLAVILSIPFGLFGSFLFAKFFGLENNIYMQTGIIMLIGLLAKTAILLTEYASEKRKNGLSITAAAISAAEARLRPILMTSLTMVFGMLPLVFATGVGANGNISLGVGLVGGMLIGTLALLFIVPVLFIIMQNLQETLMPERVLPKVDEE